MRPTKLNDLIISNLKKALGNDTNKVIDKIRANEYELYTWDYNTYVIEYDHDEKSVHFVAIVGRDIKQQLKALFNYCGNNGYNVYFRTSKKSILRFHSWMNPKIIDYKDGLYICEVNTHG
jgi:hypothetical protein